MTRGLGLRQPAFNLGSIFHEAMLSCVTVSKHVIMQPVVYTTVLRRRRENGTGHYSKNSKESAATLMTYDIDYGTFVAFPAQREKPAIKPAPPYDINYGTFVVFPKQGVKKTAAPVQRFGNTKTVGKTPSKVPNKQDAPPEKIVPEQKRESPETTTSLRAASESPQPDIGFASLNDSNSLEIIIDAGSGISVDEQQNIIEQINNDIADKRQKSLAIGLNAEKGLRNRFKAKKNGGAFPLLVNFIALAALAGGVFALQFIQNEAYVRIREGTRIFNTGERAIIEEIRRETASLLLAKDQEINMLSSLLYDVEAQLRDLVAGGGMLTGEQLILQESLMMRRESYHAALVTAREERAHILTAARSREIIVQNLFDYRIREDAAEELSGWESPQAPVRYDDARAELARISGEQARATRVENQVAAFFETANRQITARHFDNAEQTIRGLADFLDAPDFHGLVAIQARKELYIMTANALRTLLEEKRDAHETLAAANESLLAAREALAQISDTPMADYIIEAMLRQEIARLGQELGEIENIMNIETAAFTQVIAQFENTIGNLQSANTTLNTQVSNLQSENATLNTQASNLQSANATLNTQMSSLQAANTTLNTQVSNLQSENTALNAQVSNLQSENITLSSQAGNLQSASATLNTQMSGLQSENIALNTQIGDLQSANATLNTQMSNLQSQIGALQAENVTLISQAGNLQENLNAQIQAVENLRQDVQSLRTVNVSLNNQLAELRQALAN